MRKASLLFLSLVGFTTGCMGAVDVYTTNLEADLPSGNDRWSLQASYTRTEYPTGDIREEGSTFVPGFVDAIRNPERHAPASMRWSMGKGASEVDIDLPLPLHALQELPVQPETLPPIFPPSGAIGRPIDVAGMTFLALGCVANPSTCRAPIDGMVAGAIHVTSIGPLALQIDVTFTPTSGQPITLRGPLTFAITENKTSWTD